VSASSQPPTPPPLGETQATAGPASPTGVPLAVPLQRIAARFADTMVLLLINAAVFAVVAGGSGGFTGDYDDTATSEIVIVAILSLAASFAWDPMCTKLTGGTPFKLALGMRVVRAADGGAVSWGTAIVRWGVVAVWSLVPGFGLIISGALLIVSLFFLFTNPRRQAVWDQVAKTLVVRTR
jgi:uncharacterized RDD family membrane protein YckC